MVEGIDLNVCDQYMNMYEIYHRAESMKRNPINWCYFDCRISS